MTINLQIAALDVMRERQAYRVDELVQVCLGGCDVKRTASGRIKQARVSAVRRSWYAKIARRLAWRAIRMTTLLF
jgi:hypothetical protein